MQKPTQPIQIVPCLMTVQETAAYLNVSRAQVYKLIIENGLPTYRLGGAVRTRAVDIDVWLLEQKAS